MKRKGERCKEEEDGEKRKEEEGGLKRRRMVRDIK